MKVGIKYCGGCNPRYNRRKMVDFIQHHLNDKYEFEIGCEEYPYDYVLAVSGCLSKCINLEKMQGKKILVIAQEEDCEKMIYVLEGKQDR